MSKDVLCKTVGNYKIDVIEYTDGVVVDIDDRGWLFIGISNGRPVMHIWSQDDILAEVTRGDKGAKIRSSIGHTKYSFKDEVHTLEEV